MSDIEKQVNEYYAAKLASFGPGAQGVGWRNEEKQEKRFLQLSKIIEENSNFSINDLGCGTGDLLPWLVRHQYQDFSYTGYDVLDTMLDLAVKQHGQINQGSFIKVSGAGEMQSADYTVASGVFNLKYSFSEKDWIGYITGALEHMDSKSKRGFAFNMLTKYSDKEFMEDHLYYADPLFMFDHCKKNFSRNVALLHDYNEYDFTILVRK